MKGQLHLPLGAAPTPAPESNTWDYHLGTPDRGGAAAYTHLIRWAHDPKERVARGAEARAQGLRLPGSSKRVGGSVASAKLAILALFADGQPRTFNAIAVHLTGLDASSVVGSPLEAALWSLVEEETLAWACEEGCVFWLPSVMVEWPCPLASKTTEALRHHLTQLEDRIHDAYWRFTRQAKAAPPVLVVPEAYQERERIRGELRRRRAAQRRTYPATGA